MFNVRLGGLLAVVAAAAPLAAQQAIPAVRPLGKIIATAGESFANIAGIRQLSDGRLLVNDPTAHRVVMFDSSLSSMRTIADTTSNTARAYGPRNGLILRFGGDSTLFIDAASSALVVIGPDGKLGRTMAGSSANDVGVMSIARYGAAFDNRTSIVWRPFPRGMNTRDFKPGAESAYPDSAPLLRVNLATKTVDTVAMLKTTGETSVIGTCGDNCTSITQKKQPFVVADDWAMLPNGTIAVVRSKDYHIDWITPDGNRTSTGKIAHEWTRITDSTRQFLIDSLHMEDSIAKAKAKADTTTKTLQGAGFSPAASAVGGGSSVGGPVGGRPPGYVAPVSVFVDLQDIPDYRPPFFADNTTQVRADFDGNIWVKALLPVQPPGGIIYDIINGKGILIDRVQLPGGTTIAGFGKNGVVFLVARDGSGTRLSKARLR